MSLVTILSGREINNFAGQSAKSVCYNLVAMFDLFRLWLGAVLRGFRTRRSLMLENLALRQQLAVLSASNRGQGWELSTNSSGS
ncbi:MAG TPA: hypothetical protein VFC29_19980 [Candidatus Limnocylindrales bacterium]|nr:hypothetical protein [Candidatus Limnocylindrales bacterium]